MSTRKGYHVYAPPEEELTVYATFDPGDIATGFNGTSDNRKCVLVSGVPWSMDGGKVARMTISYSDLYVDFDGEVTALPCEGVEAMGETRYIDIAPIEWLTEDDDWVGAYIQSLDIAKSVKWQEVK